jgi:hypothetical protein
MTAEETRASLEGQLKEALERLKEVAERLRETEEHLKQAQAQIAELEKRKTPAPSFVKATKKKPKAEEKKPRKKREVQSNRARQRAVPTQMVEHRIVACPDCHLRLGGISLARRREVIDVPPPPRVEVSEHRIYKGWCPGCQKWPEAPVDCSEQVLGQGRIGVRLPTFRSPVPGLPMHHWR